MYQLYSLSTYIPQILLVNYTMNNRTSGLETEQNITMQTMSVNLEQF